MENDTYPSFHLFLHMQQPRCICGTSSEAGLNRACVIRLSLSVPKPLWVLSCKLSGRDHRQGYEKQVLQRWGQETVEGSHKDD